MSFFGPQNIERMAQQHDYEGLYKLLEHRDVFVRLEAAQALADLNDGTGWRFLLDTIKQEGDVEARVVAASMLGELGHYRSVPVLREALIKQRYAPLDDAFSAALRGALEAIGTPEAEQALRDAGYGPVLKGQSHTVIEYEEHYVKPMQPNTSEIRMGSAEMHMNNAADLREAEFAERGLVESSLALWIDPGLAYAWYLRGVLYEDLDRSFEALLAYRRAVELEPTLQDARAAYEELASEVDFPVEPALIFPMLSSRDWQERRDAAAAVGDAAMRGAAWARNAADRLDSLLDDEEREVRHAAVEALGHTGSGSAASRLQAMQESSWLVRFSILQALSRLGSVDGLVHALHHEMNSLQERNPVFSSQQDPLVEVEYDALMEIGVRALENTADLVSLLDLAEGNEWTEISEEEFSPLDTQALDWTDEEAEAFEEDADEDLTSYVDEVAQMGMMALERLAAARLQDLPENTLRRLSHVPDLTLLDLMADPPEPVIVYDVSHLRQTAAIELSRRFGGMP
jgi:HEAT repeat protein